ncbi:MAG: DNA gyrase inhibitor YacG [Pyrinomonas sp.]|uniref:DNA gyrase inhibitor YacG n=1 Tax=Pyrinomonas sp. TaxID=2080306 RepID=UPI0033264926
MNSARKQIRCPICGRPTTWENNPFRPFCSERCKLIDFGHWVDEDYAVPAEEEPLSTEPTEVHAPPSGDASEC